MEVVQIDAAILVRGKVSIQLGVLVHRKGHIRKGAVGSPVILEDF